MARAAPSALLCLASLDPGLPNRQPQRTSPPTGDGRIRLHPSPGCRGCAPKCRHFVASVDVSGQLGRAPPVLVRSSANRSRPGVLALSPGRAPWPRWRASRNLSAFMGTPTMPCVDSALASPSTSRLFWMASWALSCRTRSSLRLMVIFLSIAVRQGAWPSSRGSCRTSRPQLPPSWPPTTPQVHQRLASR